MFMKIVKKTGLLGLGVAAGVIFMIGMILPEEVLAASSLAAEKGSGGTMLAEGCFFDEGTGKLTITEDFGWDRIIRLSKKMDWEEIEGLEAEEVITAEIDLTGTKIFLENEGEYEIEFGHHISFRNFINLETVQFTGRIDARLKIDLYDMFDGCSKLKDCDLSGFSGADVVYMNGMFSGCSALTSLDLSSFNTSNVTCISGMFAKCSSLISLDLRNFNTPNVRSMLFMFDGCSTLTSLNLSNFDTSNVTNMCAMFQRCYNLQTIDVHNFKTLNVIDISAMFCLCDSLSEIDISNFDFEKIESKNGNSIFAKMDSVEKIKVPANLPNALQLPYSSTIPDNMESYWVNTSSKECSEIQAGLSVPMTYSRRLRTVANPSATHLAKGKTFTDSKTNCKFKVTSSSAENPTVAFAGVMKKSKKVTIPAVVTYQGVACQVTSVSAKALKGNTKIKSLKIGSSITRIEKKAFEGCKNLKKITVESEKLNFVGKNALKGIHKKCRIKVPSSNLKTYRKLFRKKGQKSTVKITK